MTRDIDDYAKKYGGLPFEAIQTGYRRKAVLNIVNKIAPKTLLEIGCGEIPLFLDLPEDIAVTIIEPSKDFADNARAMTWGRANVTVHHGYMEDFKTSENYDAILLSSVLHEVPDPIKLLKSIHTICTPATVLHINVPHARSLHRLLGVAMGVIEKPGATSPVQVMTHQRGVTYDMDMLSSEIKTAGFEIIEKGGIFVKPFTHAQMQKLVDDGFMTPQILDGFDKLIEQLPDLGSEIWVNVRRTK